MNDIRYLLIIFHCFSQDGETLKLLCAKTSEHALVNTMCAYIFYIHDMEKMYAE